MDSYSCISLCSGYGGLELGLEAGIGRDVRTVCYVEREAFAAANLVAKMESGHLAEAPVWSDLCTFNAGAWRGKVDIVTAGFPCQPFSAAGKRQGTDDDRWIWPDIARIIDECGAWIVWLENVPGLVAGGLYEVLSSLAEIGFDAEWGCIRASEVGANHHRRRVFILAYASGTGRWQDAGSTHGNESQHERRTPIQVDQPDGHGEGGGSQNVAYSNMPGTPRQQQHGGPNRHGSEPERSGKGSGQQNVAYSNGSRPQVQRVPFGIPEEHAPTFSPGWWAVEPDVGRVANGTADQVDRLRLLGNGVVPLQAAVAFRLLADRAGIEL